MGRKTQGGVKAADNRVGIYIPLELRDRINEVAESLGRVTQAQVIRAGLDLFVELRPEHQAHMIAAMKGTGNDD